MKTATHHCLCLFTMLVILSALFVQSAYAQSRPPLPLLPIPEARQLAWQRSELAIFLHFGVNTFTNREWGEGTEDPRIFNPTQLDARQWALVAKAAGFKTLILTAKHHDGFCLWPSRYTEHSIKSSPWRNGQGDIVAELAQACRELGLKMGLYLSPWDRHERSYGDSPAYNLHYTAQLRELLVNYEPVTEVWFDGACGEGPNGKKQVYLFPIYWGLVRQLSPQAVMFSDVGPDIRWIGNEEGFAGETCWSMMDKRKGAIGKADTGYLNTGEENGPDWVPGECDVSIRKGWFWHKDQDPKTVEELLNIYFKSVGRNGVLLLNVPPDVRGLIHEKDVQRLKEFRQALDAIFKINLASSALPSAGTIRSQSAEFDGSKTLDGNSDTYWAADDSVCSSWLEFDLRKTVNFNLVLLQEPISLGQRIKAYQIEALQDQTWKIIANGTTIGYKKLNRFPTVSARKVRLVIKNSRACPLIAEFGLYLNSQSKNL